MDIPFPYEKSNLLQNFNNGINQNLNEINKFYNNYPNKYNYGNFPSQDKDINFGYNNVDNNQIQNYEYNNGKSHQNQYFGNDNNLNLIKKNNEELFKKYASYRNPEYFNIKYKSVPNLPFDDVLKDAYYDDPVFLEGKLEDQTKLRKMVKI